MGAPLEAQRAAERNEIIPAAREQQHHQIGRKSASEAICCIVASKALAVD